MASSSHKVRMNLPGELALLQKRFRNSQRSSAGSLAMLELRVHPERQFQPRSASASSRPWHPTAHAGDSLPKYPTQEGFMRQQQRRITSGADVRAEPDAPSGDPLQLLWV